MKTWETCGGRYDPYERKLTSESYDQAGMRAVRRAAVEAAIPARRWGLVLGTLGRQGNPKLLDHIRSVLDGKGLQYTVVLLSEVRYIRVYDRVWGFLVLISFSFPIFMRQGLRQGL